MRAMSHTTYDLEPHQRYVTDQAIEAYSHTSERRGRTSVKRSPKSFHVPARRTSHTVIR